jgi:shikimate dehydrogenase
MKIYGLIGFPLTHSQSPEIFQQIFSRENLSDHGYQLFPMESIHKLTNLVLSNPDLRGLNVTIPFKKDILEYLDFISPEARKTGAVNCIRIDYRFAVPVLSGYNTDVPGFMESARPYLKPGHTKALVLGTGGASGAVTYALEKERIPYHLVSRKPQSPDIYSYSELTALIIREHPLIINTTPLGMYPDVESCPDIPYEAIDSRHLLIDLVYNPLKTLFLQKGEQSGATCLNGLAMLHIQAERSWQIWNER